MTNSKNYVDSRDQCCMCVPLLMQCIIPPCVWLKNTHTIYHRSYSSDTASSKARITSTTRMRNRSIRIYICLKKFAHDEYFIIFYPKLRGDDGVTATMMMIVLLSIIKKDNWTRYARSQYLTVFDYNSIAVATQELRGNIAKSAVYVFWFLLKALLTESVRIVFGKKTRLNLIQKLDNAIT